MSDESKLEDRIIDLEIKITHQDGLVDQLNQIVTQQQFTIDKMVKEILEIKLNASKDDGGGGMKNEKPPHY